MDPSSIAKDLDYFIPVLKMALAENPSLRVMAVPWSAPGWMKDSNHQHGGTLLPENTDLYARLERYHKWTCGDTVEGAFIKYERLLDRGGPRDLPILWTNNT